MSWLHEVHPASIRVVNALTCRVVLKCVGDPPTSAVKSVYFLLYNNNNNNNTLYLDTKIQSTNSVR